MIGGRERPCLPPMHLPISLPSPFDLLLDKGTLDFLICEELPRFNRFLKCVRTLTRSAPGAGLYVPADARQLPRPADARGGYGGGYYVLVSFRDPQMLVEVMEVAGML